MGHTPSPETLHSRDSVMAHSVGNSLKGSVELQVGLLRGTVGEPWQISGASSLLPECALHTLLAVASVVGAVVLSFMPFFFFFSNTSHCSKLPYANSNY